ncbi:hypothetical protein LCGC14_1260430 [marine sediment metagenome]|uniref:Uncharacterized protein n=1 Tax=marine sediment metagenome TaxID=412755 RepID=A0A0F9L0Y7_9ZZZZ
MSKCLSCRKDITDVIKSVDLKVYDKEDKTWCYDCYSERMTHKIKLYLMVEVDEKDLKEWKIKQKERGYESIEELVTYCMNAYAYDVFDDADVERNIANYYR